MFEGLDQTDKSTCMQLMSVVSYRALLDLVFAMMIFSSGLL